MQATQGALAAHMGHPLQGLRALSAMVERGRPALERLPPRTAPLTLWECALLSRSAGCTCPCWSAGQCLHSPLQHKPAEDSHALSVMGVRRQRGTASSAAGCISLPGGDVHRQTVSCKQMSVLPQEQLGLRK